MWQTALARDYASIISLSTNTVQVRIFFRKMQKGDCVPLLNDILVAKDGSYLKEIFICSEEKDEAILSSIAIFRPDTNIIMPEILLYLLKQPSVRKDVGDNYVSGSALPRIVLKDFKKYRFMLPPMDEQLKIGSVLHAIRMQTKTNIDEIQCLSSTRDALLPKLMSGELGNCIKIKYPLFWEMSSLFIYNML